MVMVERARDPRNLVTLLIFPAAALLLILAATAGDFDLRQWASLYGAVVMMLLLWRMLSTLPHLSLLARALSTAMVVNLAAAAIAGFTLAAAWPPPPPNTSGLVALIIGRTAILLVAIFWHRLINAWGGAFGHDATPPEAYSR